MRKSELFDYLVNKGRKYLDEHNVKLIREARLNSDEENEVIP